MPTTDPSDPPDPLSTAAVADPVTIARVYLGAQAVAGSLWWVGVFLSDDIRRLTLGGWSPAVLVGPDLTLFVGASALAAITARRTPRVSAAASAVGAVWTTAVTLALAVHGLTERTAGWGVVSMTVATVGSAAAAATLRCGYLPTRWFFVGPFSFRVAPTTTGARHLRRSLAQVLVFWSTFFAAIPLVLTTIERRLHLSLPLLERWAPVGSVVFAVASTAALWSCVTMATLGRGTPLPAATASELVVAGPYRIVRNPMALTGALQTAAVGLWLGSWTVIAVAAAGAVVWHVLIRPVEEADLAARFGDAYRQYSEDVRCWIPRPPRGWRHPRPRMG